MSQGVRSGLQEGWVTWVIWCFIKKLHKIWCMSGYIVIMKLPVTSCDLWIIWIVSTEECSRLMQNWMHICSPTSSVILNVMATQYTWLLNGIYHSHWLIQRSCPCSRMHIPVHSPWLPGYIDVAQTILIIFIMAGLFPDRPHIYIYIYLQMHIQNWKKYMR